MQPIIFEPLKEGLVTWLYILEITSMVFPVLGMTVSSKTKHFKSLSGGVKSLSFLKYWDTNEKRSLLQSIF